MKIHGISIDFEKREPGAPGPAWVADIGKSIATIERDGTDADRITYRIFRTFRIDGFFINRRSNQ